MSAQENRDLVKKYFDGVNAGNLDVVDEVFETNYSHHDPANPDPNGVGGVDDVKFHLNALLSAFPDMNFQVDDTIAGDESIIVRWTATCTHTGDYFGIAPTNKSATITGMNTWRFEDGKAVEGWVNRDDIGLLQQLGVIPSQ
jgi:steroid delta-isomerase-like uncharacterized protein